MEKNIIPYGKQNITNEDLEAVIGALKGTYLTQGPIINEFELEFAKYVDCKYAVAVSNGTAALHLSALAMGVNNNSKVITSPNTFAATANCVRYCGGEVVFADIDPETYLIDLNKVELILNSFPIGTFAGIIPVDFAGRPVDLERLRYLANKFGCWIIEDACHAPGGYFVDTKGKHQRCGNGVFADLAIFSFHPVKHITTGEGGMITTNNEDLYKKLLNLRSHGIVRDPKVFINSKEFANGIESSDYPGWFMEMQQLGYNYRFTDFQAALGLSQLKRAVDGINRRKEIAKVYFNAFKNESFILSQSGLFSGHAYHLYVIEVIHRKRLYDYLKNKGILAQIHYIPVYRMPYYQEIGYRDSDFPNSEKYYKGCISLPMYPELTSQEQKYIIKCVKQFYLDLD